MASLLPHELRSVFEAPSELSALKDYASKTFCEENIAFLEEVLSMKSSKSTSMVSPIIQKYIRPDSPCQVNLDSETRTRIMNLAKDPEVIKQLTLFDAAFEHVARLLTLDTLPKFRGQHPTMGHEEHVGPNSTYVVEPTGQVQTWFRGHLLRRKGFFSQWKPHTYMKKGSYLFEFRPGANHIKSSPLQTMVLDGSLVEPARTITGRDFSFILHLRDGKSLFFQASSKEEMEDWMDHLSGASQFKIQKSLRASASSASSMTFHTSSSRVSSSGSHNEAQSSSHSISSPQAGTMDEAELAKALPILSFLESFTDAVIVADHSSTILAFNSAAEKLFGYKADEIKGQRLPVLMPEPYKSRHDGYMFRHEKFGDEKLIGKTRDLKGERKGGEVFPLQISLGKLPLKGHYIATIRELGLDKDEDEVPK